MLGKKKLTSAIKGLLVIEEAPYGVGVFIIMCEEAKPDPRRAIRALLNCILMVLLLFLLFVVLFLSVFEFVPDEYALDVGV